MIVFPRKGQRPIDAGILRARIVVARSQLRSLTLTAQSYRLVRLGAPTIIEIKVKVKISRGLAGCRQGTSGKLVITNSGSMLPNGRAGDAVSLRLASGCARATRRWSNSFRLEAGGASVGVTST